MRLEDLQPDASVRGFLPDARVTVASVEWHDSDALTLAYWGPFAHARGALQPRAGGNSR